MAIGLLERFIADWEMQHSARPLPEAVQPSGEKVAVVGSGPAGLAAAADLAASGHTVTVFEALPVLGGVLAWGIPSFRLPAEVLDYELAHLRKLGVEFRTSVKIGRDVSIEDLMAHGYRAVFIAAGTDVPTPLRVQGEELAGVYCAVEFLAGAKLNHLGSPSPFERPKVGSRVAVIGGGNTAMDAAQTALRLGAAEVTVVYRRSEVEMPARKEEAEAAREEGVRFHFLAAPTRFLGEGNGQLAAMECIQMELGEPGPDGRRRPVPKPGSEFVLPVDTVVLALGFSAEKGLADTTPELQVDGSGYVVVDAETGRTSRRGIWAGGDIVTGPDTVVRAMASGKKAAADIDRYLRGESDCEPQPSR